MNLRLVENYFKLSNSQLIEMMEEIPIMTKDQLEDYILVLDSRLMNRR